MRIVGTRPGEYQLASNKENFKIPRVRVFFAPVDDRFTNGRRSRASGMSSASSPGAVSRVVGYSTTDPTTTFVRGIHTLKNGSYYKRSWTSGSPYSSVPIWLDMDHCPPQQREFVVRPDLALTAMQRILSRIEKEEQAELDRRQALQDTRQERLARLRQRHMQRHHAQQAIGVKEPQGVRKDFNQKSMVRLQRSASAASSAEQSQHLEPSPAVEAEASASASSQAPGERGLSSSSSMDLLAQIAPVGEVCMLKKANPNPNPPLTLNPNPNPNPKPYP